MKPQNDSMTPTPYRLLIPLAIAAIVLASCGNQSGSQGHGRMRSSPPPIPTATVRPTTIQAHSSLSGVIAPLQNVAISSSLTEPTDAVNVNEGDHVTRGEALAVLDTADLRANRAQAQSTVETDIRTAASLDAKVAQARYTARLNIDQGGDQVKTARAALLQARQTFAEARIDLQRDRQLLANGYISQQTVDQQVTTMQNDAEQVRSAQASVQSALTNQQVNGTNSTGLQAANVQSAIADARAAHATVDQARAQVLQYQTQIDKATITSPIDGVVVNRNLNLGEYPGSRTLFTIQEIDHMYAELNASSPDTFAIPVGANASLTISGNQMQMYTGKVVGVLGQVAPGSTNFTVKILLANPKGTLQSGLPVTANITLPPVTGMGVPVTAFLDDTHTSLMIADDQLDEIIAKTIHVRELGSNGTTSIVSGLKSGDAIVTNGQLGLSDGQTL
jgi:HlyD family secretion protein